MPYDGGIKQICCEEFPLGDAEVEDIGCKKPPPRDETDSSAISHDCMKQDF